MSTTPLMSEFPEDKKPLYPIDESDVELTVGGQTAPQTRCGGCFWSRFRRSRCGANGERKPRSPIRRAIRWFLTICLVLGLVGFFAARHHVHKFRKTHPIICVPITDSTTTVELPLANFRTHLSLHPSLTSNDVKVTHSDKVANHTVSVSFDLPKDAELRDAEDDAKFFVCHIAGPRFVALGVHAKHTPPKDGEFKHHHLNMKKEHDDHPAPPHDGHHHPPPHRRPHGPLIKATSTTITLPAAAAGHPRSISFQGPGRWFGHGRFGHGCMKKQIKMAIAKAIREEKVAKEAVLVEEEAM
ncbi:hypothetical protein FRC04_000572 [Tulasnella sp. 424]|nr:hypothetical protein FRC04_000572 [Tulasnella sp. 424]KAG8967909.1 hypothetical protein FRC05_001874 [Tulasnella sp. 425]